MTDTAKPQQRRVLRNSARIRSESKAEKYLRTVRDEDDDASESPSENTEHGAHEDGSEVAKDRRSKNYRSTNEQLKVESTANSTYYVLETRWSICYGFIFL